MREGCSVCETEFRRFARTIAEMGFASEEVQAPDYIRDLLLARIERENQPFAPAAAQTRQIRSNRLRKNPLLQPLRLLLPKRGRKNRAFSPGCLRSRLLLWPLARIFCGKHLRIRTGSCRQNSHPRGWMQRNCKSRSRLNEGNHRNCSKYWPLCINRKHGLPGSSGRLLIRICRSDSLGYEGK